MKFVREREIVEDKWEKIRRAGKKKGRGESDERRMPEVVDEADAE